MIVTFTANPSVDRTAEVATLERGQVHRLTGARVDAGGKGVNVARALVANGIPSTAVLPLGGPAGAQLRVLLEADGLGVRAVAIAGGVRTNTTIAEADGTTTKLNEAGPRLAPCEVAALCEELLAAATGAAWAVLAGSLPPGAPPDLYATLVTGLRASGVRVAVDADGAPLSAAIPAGPDLIKPNEEELAEAAGRAVAGPRGALAAIEVLRARGARAVLASLGAEGAVLVDETGAHHARGPAVVARSTVGAGDALLAGFLAAGGRGPDALAAGVAWGTAAVSLPGSRMPRPADIDLSPVHVLSLDPQEVTP